jgi:hypothetical protein
MSRDRSALTTVWALIASALIVSCSDSSSDESGAFPDTALATVTSTDGALRVEIRTTPDQPPTRGTIEVEYRVHDATGKAVSGLALDVQPWMPAHGHGASVVPSITDEGDGRYVAKNVTLFMAGSWELRTTVSGDPGESWVLPLEIP